MKTQYLKPSIKVRKTETENILAASDPIGTTVYDEQAGTNAIGLAKKNIFTSDEGIGHIDWDDDED